MELKIWVDGIQRIVCGVKGTTTCQDVVFALAHACGKLGRFTLIERWRNNERLLSPNENPLKILLNWGEYANDVQFILKTTEQHKIESESEEPTANLTKNSCTIDNKCSPPVNISIIDEHKHINSSLVVDNKPLENIGIVKGVQKKYISENTTIPEIGININKNNKLGTDFKAKDGKKRDYKINISPDVNCVMNENILNTFNYDEIVNNNELLKSTPLISSNGALVPPPYREPPPPRSSPVQNNCDFNDSKFDLKECANIISSLNFTKSDELNEYKDLFQLIKLQREKLSSQQADISKCDAEIIYLKNKESDKNQVYDDVSREMNKASQLCHLGNEQLRTLQYVEEENELVRQQEKTLKSEITLLRSKLANCETELLQCKNKIRMLLDDIQIEQRTLDCKDNRQLMERNFMIEVERIQAEIDQAIHNTELSCKTTEDLQKEIILIENNISEKKRQVEQLVNDMKEINLQSLAVTTSDEIRNILEGPSKLSSSRRIIGSPRQLENAVPTSKNPHGVWV